MTKYLAGVLTVMTAGVLLIAYGALGSRAAGFGYANPYPYGVQPAFVSGQQPGYVPGTTAWPYGVQPSYGYGVQAPYPYDNPYMTNGVVATPIVATAPAPVQPVRTVQTAPAAPRRVVRTTVVERPRRDWKKTAMVIGGSSAAGAGIGGIFGGKKGALIGAAIGGGGATIYETTKNRY